MKSVHKSVLIWYSPQQMFDLVADVASYPQFLPWCDHARVLQEHDDGVTGEVGMKLSALRQSFVTRNTYAHEGSTLKLLMGLVKGPFSSLQGEWIFTPVGGDTPGAMQASKVELRLNYGFSNIALAAVVGPVFEKIATSMVDAFVKRAEQVYG